LPITPIDRHNFDCSAAQAPLIRLRPTSAFSSTPHTHPRFTMVIKKPANLLAQYLRKNVSSTSAGVVVSAGKMSKAVKVRIVGQEWNKHIRKVRFPLWRLQTLK
jgi:hypothetical protein